MEFTTPRLQLRPVVSADALFLLELHRNPDLLRFIPSAALADVAAAREMAARLRTLDDDPVLGYWLVMLRSDEPSGQEPVGMVILKRIPASAGVAVDDVEIGWRQLESQCGHGYMAEAARAVLDHAHASGVERVVAVVDPANVKSANVCRRLGMRAMGRSRDYYDTETELFVSSASGFGPDQGPFFHGTRAALAVGDELVVGHRSNFGERAANFLYFSSTLDAAAWGAELAAGDGAERVFVVEPTGGFEDDPNVTDKKFPGNPTRSYRTRSPLRIVGEVDDWPRHPDEVLARMRAAVAGHVAAGAEVIGETTPG